MTEALGIIETIGFTAGIQAADAAVKSANVKLARWIKVGGGRVGIVIRGDVASVKTAVEAGRQAASAIGLVECEVIIARPSDKLTQKFPLDAFKIEKKQGK